VAADNLAPGDSEALAAIPAKPILTCILPGALVVVVPVLLLLAPPVLAGGEPPAAESDPARELEELGETLKAAALSGTISEEDAWVIYKTMAARLAGDDWGENEDGADEKRDSSPKQDVVRLSAPAPEQIRTLFEPEFLRRDVGGLAAALDLGAEQVLVAELLLSDYREALELASTPLREAMRRYRRAATDQWLAAALDRAEVDDVETAVGNMEARLEEIASWSAEKDASAADPEKEAAREEWGQRMLEVTARLDERLDALRVRVAGEVAALEAEGAVITGDELLGLARRFRAERSQLRAEMVEALRLITTAEQRGEGDARFVAALERIRIERLLPKGRLGGEPMNLWAAAAETFDSQAPDAVQAVLQRSASSIVARLDARAEATLDRELAGLELSVFRAEIRAADAVDEQRLAAGRAPFADAARVELIASVAVRDALLALLEESARSAGEPGRGLSERYRAAALRPPSPPRSGSTTWTTTPGSRWRPSGPRRSTTCNRFGRTRSLAASAAIPNGLATRSTPGSPAPIATSSTRPTCGSASTTRRSSPSTAASRSRSGTCSTRTRWRE
jgi:hypothetical protein